MASHKQRAANKRNAQNSTGPITLVGKQISSRNAVKTEVYSNQLTVLNDECPVAFQEFKEGYYRAYNPISIVEQIAVENIVKIDWKLLRFDRQEHNLLMTKSTCKQYANPLANNQELIDLSFRKSRLLKESEEIQYSLSFIRGHILSQFYETYKGEVERMLALSEEEIRRICKLTEQVLLEALSCVESIIINITDEYDTFKSRIRMELDSIKQQVEEENPWHRELYNLYHVLDHWYLVIQSDVDGIDSAIGGLSDMSFEDEFYLSEFDENRLERTEKRLLRRRREEMEHLQRLISLRHNQSNV